MGLPSTTVRRWLAPFVAGILPLTLLFAWPIDSVGFSLPRVALTGVLTGLVLLCILCVDDVHPFRVLLHTWAGRLSLALFCVIVLSPLWSVAPLRSFFGSAERMQGVLFCVTGMTLLLVALWMSAWRRDEWAIRGAIVLCNAVLVCIAFLQLVGVNPLPWWEWSTMLGRATSLTGQPNTLALALVLTWPFVFHARQSASAWGRALFGVQALAGYLVLCASGSRSGLLGFAVAALILVVVFRRYLRSALERFSSSQQLLIGMSIPILIAVGFVLVQQRFTYSTEIGRSETARALLWQGGVELWAKQPWGYGLETIDLVYPSVFDSVLYAVEPLAVLVDRTHVFPLDIFLTVGPFFAIVLLAFCCALVAEIWRRRHVQPELWIGGTALIGGAVTVFFGFLTPLTALLFCLIVGWILGQCSHGKREGIALHIRLALAVLLLLHLTAVILAGQWIHAHLIMSQSSRALEQGQLAQATVLSSQALGVFPYDRTVIVKSTEDLLHMAEATTNQQTRARLLQEIDNRLSLADDLTGGQDSMVALLRAWRAALEQDVTAFRQYFAKAESLQPQAIATYRIGAHGAGLIGDRAAERRMQQQLLLLLPPGWNDLQTETGRILQKENAWLKAL